MPIYNSAEDLCTLLDLYDALLEMQDMQEHPVNGPPPHPESNVIFLAQLPHQFPDVPRHHFYVGPERVPMLMEDREPYQTRTQVVAGRGGQTQRQVPRPRPTTSGLRLGSTVARPMNPVRLVEESDGEQPEAGGSGRTQRQRPTRGGLRLASTVARPINPETWVEESEGEQPHVGRSRQTRRQRPTTGGLRLASTVTR